MSTIGDLLEEAAEPKQDSEVRRQNLHRAARMLGHELPKLNSSLLNNLRKRIAFLREHETPDEYMEGYLAAMSEILAAFDAATNVQGLEAEIVWRRPKPPKRVRCRCRCR